MATDAEIDASYDEYWKTGLSLHDKGYLIDELGEVCKERDKLLNRWDEFQSVFRSIRRLIECEPDRSLRSKLKRELEGVPKRRSMT